MKTVNPHIMEPDAALLDRYVTRRDEAAFRQIVERHAGMVLGVARRRTNDATLAEEAGQIVFTLLARKAPALRHLPPDKLGGWLHRTALLTAANLLRSEMRRRLHHERFAADAVSAAAAGPEESAWHAALPFVDEAIDSLPEADRQLVVQHFYQRRTFRELSTGTGRTEDTVRKRTGRALERLSNFFKRRGISLSAGAIVTGLSARVTEAAPSGYAATAAAAAVNKASSVSMLTVISNTLATMALTKITVTAAAVAFFTPLGLHWSGSTATATAPPAAAAASVKPDAGNGTGAVHPGSTAAGSAAISGRSATLARFAQELARLTPPPADEHRLTELQRLVFALPESELGPAFQLLRTSSAKAVLGPVASAIAARWAEFNPAEALRMARTLPKELQPPAWSGALQVWARRDFNAAFAWACAQPEGEDRDTQLDTVYNDLMKRDPVAALTRLQEIPTAAKREQYRRWTLELWRSSDPDAAITWINTKLPEETRDRTLTQFIQDWSGTRPDFAVEYALKHITNPFERENTIRFAFSHWGWHDPAAAIATLISLPPELQTANMARNFGPFIAHGGDPDALLEATGKLPPGEFRDALHGSVAWRLTATDIDRAKELAASLTTRESRREAFMSIGSVWMQRDPAAARLWIEASPDIPGDDKKRLLNQTKK